jgi:hypothetical protein
MLVSLVVPERIVSSKASNTMLACSTLVLAVSAAIVLRG